MNHLVKKSQQKRGLICSHSKLASNYFLLLMLSNQSDSWHQSYAVQPQLLDNTGTFLWQLALRCLWDLHVPFLSRRSEDDGLKKSQLKTCKAWRPKRQYLWNPLLWNFSLKISEVEIKSKTSHLMHADVDVNKMLTVLDHLLDQI